LPWLRNERIFAITKSSISGLLDRLSAPLAKVPPALAAAVLDRGRAMIEDAVDRMKTDAIAAAEAQAIARATEAGADRALVRARSARRVRARFVSHRRSGLCK